MAWLIDELGRFDCRAESSVSGGGEEPSASIVLVRVALERVGDQTGLGEHRFQAVTRLSQTTYDPLRLPPRYDRYSVSMI